MDYLTHLSCIAEVGLDTVEKLGKSLNLVCTNLSYSDKIALWDNSSAAVCGPDGEITKLN